MPIINRKLKATAAETLCYRTIYQRDGKFLRALKFIAKRAPTSIKAGTTAIGFADVKTIAPNKTCWLNWHEASKCKNLK
jgi:hypothetical protein